MTLQRPAYPAKILMVEDDENDVHMMREAFDLAQCDVELHVVSNGVECMAFLRREGRFADVPMPELVLLDLNMPVMDGRQTMQAILADQELKALPVIVMSTSKAMGDIQQMYDMRCSTYIVKPLDFAELQSVADLVYQYWFTLAALPRPTVN